MHNLTCNIFSSDIKKTCFPQKHIDQLTILSNNFCEENHLLLTILGIYLWSCVEPNVWSRKNGKKIQNTKKLCLWLHANNGRNGKWTRMSNFSRKIPNKANIVHFDICLCCQIYITLASDLLLFPDTSSFSFTNTWNVAWTVWQQKKYWSNHNFQKEKFCITFVQHCRVVVVIHSHHLVPCCGSDHENWSANVVPA